eukprot:95139_1
MCIHMIELGLIIRSELSDRMDWLIAIIIESVTLFLMSFIPTAYPIYLHRKQCQMRELSKYQTNLASAHSNSELQISPHHKTHNRMGHMLTVIADENGFNAFMEHLINEFATESLLFIVELIQIKYEYQTAHGHKLLTPQSAIQGASSPFNFIKLDSLHSETSADLDNPVESYIMNENGTVWAKISLPVGIPRSEALTSSKQLKEQMYSLYAKYVSVSSVHTLNIGSDLRKAMDAYFSNNYEQIIHELQAQHKLNIKIKPAAAAATTLEIVSSDSNAPPLIPSKAGNAPPNTPLPAEDSMCTPILDGTPGKKSPSRSRSKSRSRTRSRSKGKIGLKDTLSTPILDGTHDEFPNIPIAKSAPVVIKNNAEPAQTDLEAEMPGDINQIPDDFMVILDYNMDEKEEEEEGIDHEMDHKSETEDHEAQAVVVEVVDDDEEAKKEHEKEMIELLNILDGVCIEMVGLLFGPYLRFVKT